MRENSALVTGAGAVAFQWATALVPVAAGAASQQALGTSVMGGMIAVVILALLMVPVFFVSVQRVLAGDREKAKEAKVAQGAHAPAE